MDRNGREEVLGMAKPLVLLSLCLIALSGCCLGTIRPGCWTITNPVRYNFDGRSVGDYSIEPTLTLGSNGVMLSVQVMSGRRGLPPLRGQEVTAKVETPSGTLQQLEAPAAGPLLEIMGVPFAIWNFAPPPTGQSVVNVTVVVRGASVSWPLAGARNLGP